VEPDDLPARVKHATVPGPGARQRDRFDVAQGCHTIPGWHHIILDQCQEPPVRRLLADLASAPTRAPDEHPQPHVSPFSMAYRVAALLLTTPIFLKIDRR
jgi:hypothetical protein